MTTVEILKGDTIKQGDCEPGLRMRLINEDGEPMDLMGFQVEARIRSTTTGDKIVDGAISLIDARNGIVEYDWNTNDTQNAGIYEGEVTAYDSQGCIITFPNSSYFNIQIMERID